MAIIIFQVIIIGQVNDQALALSCLNVMKRSANKNAILQLAYIGYVLQYYEVHI